MKISQYQITQTVDPVVEPVTLAQMKTHLRVDGTDEDALITAQIQAAREWVEKELQRSLVQRTYRADLWGFADCMELPLPPLSSVTSIKYYTPDSPQVLTTLSSDVYRVDLGRGHIYRENGQSWVSTSTRHDAVQITFVAGYAPTTDSPQDYAGNVPEAIKAAIKLTVADMFENRETTTPMKITMLPTVKRLISIHREY